MGYMSTRRKRSIFELFEEIRNQINRMFEEVFEPIFPLETPMSDVSRRELQPLTHVSETAENIIVTVDLPCVRKEDIKISATENMVKVEAPMKECVKFSPYGTIQKEAEFDVFKKTIRLPVAVEPEKAKARFKSGILEIVLPKKTVGFRIPVE